MLHCNYPYVDTDGDHWPDAIVGDAQFYAVNFEQWISAENETLVTIDWSVPAGVEASDDFHTGVEAYVKLAPKQRGTFEILCQLNTTETANDIEYTGTKTIRVFLKVT